MFEQHILPLIADTFLIEDQTEVTRIQLFGIGESNLQDNIHRNFPDWPKDVEVGFRAGAVLELKLTTYDAQFVALRKLWQTKLEKILADFIIGYEDDTLASSLLNLAIDKKILITTAESCTGGKITSQITSLAGASKIFEAGFICYSNQQKQNMLGVKAKTLEQYGAVSEPVVLEMLNGALINSSANIGVAVSGIAGPEGGSEEKPVGTVCLAWGSLENPQSQTFFLPFGRTWMQELTTNLALDLLRRFIFGQYQLSKHLDRYIK